MDPKTAGTAEAADAPKGGTVKITKKWLKEQGACSGGVDWFMAFGKTDSVDVISGLLEAERFNWANWLIVRLLDRKNHIRYAIFAAEQVISIFEKKCPEDKRPRLAIEAAKAVIENDTKETRAAACAAYAAANTAALAAGDAAGAAAGAAAWAAAGDEMKEKIVRYGLELHKKEKRKKGKWDAGGEAVKAATIWTETQSVRDCRIGNYLRDEWFDPEADLKDFIGDRA